MFDASVTWGGLIVALALFVGASIVSIVKCLTPHSALRGYIYKFTAAVLGYLGAKLHLKFFNRRFLAQGTLSKLMKLP